MKAIIQKDLQENLKVALIGLLIFSLMLLQAYQTCITALTDLLTRNNSVQASTLQPLLATNLLTEAIFFCAIFGAGLGWLQTRNEAHRDLWAFLIHRPATRTEIFQGKAIAGLCLYVFGAGLPLVILVGVVRMPGHVTAPFEWAMVMPLVLIFLTGIGFYFAGMLTGLRQVRWFASRSFGLALAIISSAGVFAATEFWQSLVLTMVVVVVLATAVWGAYQSGGFYRGQPMIGRFALTAAMTAGCGAVLFIGLGLVFTLIVNPLSHHSSVSSNYAMTRDGIIYKETFRDGELVEIADLDGHPLLDPKTGQQMEQKEFSQRIAYGGTVVTTLKNRYQGGNVLQNPAHFFNLWNITDKTIWYLDRHGKLTGYDGRTRKSVGSLEPHGYDGTLVSEPFLNQPNFYYYYNSYNDMPQKLIATAKSVYQVDFKTRALKPVFTLTNEDEIGGYAGINIYVDANGSKQSLLFTTRKTVQLLDYAGQSIFAVPYQPGYFEHPQVQLSFLPSAKSSTNNPTTLFTNKFAIWFIPDYELNRKSGWKMPTHILWLGPEQAVTKSADLPSLLQDEESSLPDKLATAFLPPPAHMTFDKKIYSVWNVFSYALAFMCAAVGWTLARRYNFSTKASIGWTLFVFLLGIPGLLTFLCVQEWPAREVCLQCKKLRAVDRECCEHCEAPFSPPEKNGTEIFAPLAKA